MRGAISSHPHTFQDDHTWDFLDEDDDDDNQSPAGRKLHHGKDVKEEDHRSYGRENEHSGENEEKLRRQASSDESDGDVKGGTEKERRSSYNRLQTDALLLSSVETEIMQYEPKRREFEVTVEDPEIRNGSNLSFGTARYLVYVVRGSAPGGENFCSRKRYSDFEWLRRTIQKLLPGISLPAIPHKRKVGRFEEPFVQARRRGLQDFLVRIFNRNHLSDMSVVRVWLTKSDENLEAFKSEISCRSWAAALQEYHLLISQNPSLCRPLLQQQQEYLPPTIKSFLTTHLKILKKVRKHSRAIMTFYLSQKDAIDSLSSALEDISQHESKFYGTDVVPMPAASIWQAEKNLRSEAPSGHYEILHAWVIREIQDTESLADALSSLEQLVDKKVQTQQKLTAAESAIRKLQTGQSTSNRITNIFSRRDRLVQLQEMTAEADVQRENVRVLSEWDVLARSVLNCSFQNFLKEKACHFNQSMEDLAKRQMNYSLQETDIWKSFLKESLLPPSSMSSRTETEKGNSESTLSAC